MKGTDLYLSLWRAWDAVVEVDRRSIAEAGFRIPTDFAILEILHHKGSQTMGALGSGVLLTSGSTTTAIDRLEQEGMVRRQRSASDARVVLVELTEVGKERIAKVFPQHAARLEALFGDFGREERGQLAGLLRRLRKNAVALRGEPKAARVSKEVLSGEIS